MPPPCRRLTLDELHVDDEPSFRHVGLFSQLAGALRRDEYRFRVDTSATWDRALFLNLTYWDANGQGDVLAEETIPADVVMHVAWHHLARRALGAASGTADGLLLAEAIASAFDLFLVGRLLGHAPESNFLATQVPALAEAAEAAGLAEKAFETLLEDIALEPDRAFEDLRQLLFDTSSALVRAAGVEEATTILATAASHRFGALLHHYELSTWVLYARAYASDRAAFAPNPEARRIDGELRAAKVSLELLETAWLKS